MIIEPGPQITTSLVKVRQIVSVWHTHRHHTPQLSRQSFGLNCTGLVSTIDTPQTNMSNNKNGWFIDLPTSGERVVSNPKIRNNTLFFNTLIPDNTVCSAGGSGWLMSVNLENGGIPLKEIFDIITRINREEKTTVLLVEQNARMALSVAQHGYILEVGRMVMDDTTERLQANEDVQEFYLGMREEGVRGTRRWKKKKQWR